VIADAAWWVVIEILGWPLEWAIERIWRLHRREPAWRRRLGGALLCVLSAVALVAYVAALAGAAYGVYWLVARVV
jgi:hypothetical protein